VFRSIRWSLLFWYALILLTVIGGFGATLYLKVQRSLYREVDTRLKAHARALAGSLQREGGGSFELELSDEYVKYFSGQDSDDPYYMIWDDQGHIIDRSRTSLQLPRPDAPGIRGRGHRREFAAWSPKGAWVVVGQRLDEERDKLRDLLGAVAGGGAAIVVVALAGGWFLAGWALRPVRRMSQAASEISAANLSRRIDPSLARSELGELARVLNEAFDRLEKAFERQTRFTADASHELRTPLSIMMTQAELALRKERTGPEYREALETSLKAAQRMKAVVEGLLTLARADAQDLNLRKERLDLRTVVEETASMLGPLAVERKVALTVSAESVEVLGDRDRLREVAANLIANAIRYNREGGKVDVALAAAGEEAVLTVADTGIGIPEKDQGHIFERFYRVDKNRSREQGGSGLGLAIAKWVVEAHGGHLSFASREGQGTTFTVRLSRASAAGG
jgi:heavy metal sensor kinase